MKRSFLVRFDAVAPFADKNLRDTSELYKARKSHTQVRTIYKSNVINNFDGTLM